jgi:hypothetical protein
MVGEEVTPAVSAPAKRNRQVERLLTGEGLANLAVMFAKAAVGFQTGSIAALDDAIHSLVDFANNIVAFIATRIASAPPDWDHPYGPEIRNPCGPWDYHPSAVDCPTVWPIDPSNVATTLVGVTPLARLMLAVQL